jgi:hypothetical protein
VTWKRQEPKYKHLYFLILDFSGVCVRERENKKATSFEDGPLLSAGHSFSLIIVLKALRMDAMREKAQKPYHQRAASRSHRSQQERLTQQTSGKRQ